jgi:hypothetical protein
MVPIVFRRDRPAADPLWTANLRADERFLRPRPGSPANRPRIPGEPCPSRLASQRYAPPTLPGCARSIESGGDTEFVTSLRGIRFKDSIGANAGISGSDLCHLCQMCRPDPETFSIVLLFHGDLPPEVAHLAQSGTEEVGEMVTNGRSSIRSSCRPLSHANPPGGRGGADSDRCRVALEKGSYRLLKSQTTSAETMR